MAKPSESVIDWDKYPKLANIFEERPRGNVYWQELDRFVADYGLTVTPNNPPALDLGPKDDKA